MADPYVFILLPLDRIGFPLMMGLCFRRMGYSVSVNPSKRQDADVAVVRVVVVLAARRIDVADVVRVARVRGAQPPVPVHIKPTLSVLRVSI